MESRHISVIIHAAPQRVYSFASQPTNLPAWAAGLATSDVEVVDGQLIVESPMGRVAVEFVPANPYGVLDHNVTLPNDVVVTNPMRVLAHPEGSEVLFTVRQFDASDEEFERDCQAVSDDLHQLKKLLEQAA